MNLNKLLQQRDDFVSLLEEFPVELVNMYKDEIDDFGSNTHNILYSQNVFRVIADAVSEDNISETIKGMVDMSATERGAKGEKEEYWVYDDGLYFVRYKWNYCIESEFRCSWGSRFKSMDTYRLIEPVNIELARIDSAPDIEKSKGLLFMIWESGGFKTHYNKWVLPDSLRNKLWKYNNKYCRYMNNGTTREWY